MNNRPVISQELFDALVDEAVKDLFKSGLSREEVIKLIEKQFGHPYVHRFLKKP